MHSFLHFMLFVSFSFSCFFFFDSILGTFEWLGPSHVTLAQLPSCLKTLSLWDNFKFAEENLSRFINLTHLSFQKDFYDKVDGRLPPNLTIVSSGSFLLFGILISEKIFLI